MSDADSILLFKSTKPRVARRPLRDFAHTLQQDLTGGRPFTCLFTDDGELRRLNRDFLRHDYPTDVLSFPSLAPAGSLGDLAISLERAREQAAAFGHAIDDEVRVLMLHGVLHLLGYDHETDSGQMRRVESRWRQRLGLPAGLIARSATAR